MSLLLHCGYTLEVFKWVTIVWYARESTAIPRPGLPRRLKPWGLSVSDAIRLLLLRIAEEKRLPFAVKVPNSTTVKAMKELEEGKGQTIP